MQRVSVEEAGFKLSNLVEAAKNGEEVILTQNNIAVARLLPEEMPAKAWQRRLGTAAGQVWIADDFDAIPEGFEEYL